jgi:hypothetical protein
VSKIAFEILSYLVDHPKSRDTMNGILEWWLPEQQINYQSKKVKDALSELIQKKLVLKLQGRDASTHYRINNQKTSEIKAFLKDQSM